VKLAIVLSTHAAQFQAVAFKGDFEANVKRIAAYGYAGVELAIRDPKLVMRTNGRGDSEVWSGGTGHRYRAGVGEASFFHQQ
jgi:hypothetical protein